jgi:hypothetical protein
MQLELKAGVGVIENRIGAAGQAMALQVRKKYVRVSFLNSVTTFTKAVQLKVDSG